MADAKALFRKHANQLGDLQRESPFKENSHLQNMFMAQVVLYGFCILAEAIRNDMDEFEVKQKEIQK